jgi:hypothetical protein
MRMMPDLFLVAAETSCPKSLSSVSGNRHSDAASSMTFSSSTPGMRSAIETASCPATRTPTTTVKSQLSSTSSRMICG